MSTSYVGPDQAPTREEVDALRGRILLEFGTGWCGFCNALAPDVAALVAEHPEVRHLKVEDGPGRRLGRSFRVKLWPNFVLMRDGEVLAQLARPSAAELRATLKARLGAE